VLMGAHIVCISCSSVSDGPVEIRQEKLWNTDI